VPKVADVPGHVVSQWRKTRGLSQQALAVKLGMSAAAVTQWERGVIVPRRATVERLDEVLEADGAILAAFGYTAGLSADDPDRKIIPLDDAARLRQLIAEQALQLSALTARVEDLGAELRLLRLVVGRGVPDSA
jgi:transcriptional regulator with XRE-family HTH domain